MPTNFKSVRESEPKTGAKKAGSANGTLGRTLENAKLKFGNYRNRATAWFKLKWSKRRAPGAPKSFKLEKRQRKSKISPSSAIIADSFRFLKQNWKLFTILLFFYIAAYFVFAYATPNIDLATVFDGTEEAAAQPDLGTKLKTLSSALLTYRGQANDFARWAQLILAVIFSLVFIYAIRRRHQGEEIRARDALYSGTTNLIPFFGGMALIAIQLLPMTIVGALYNLATARELLVNTFEEFVAGTLFAGSVLLTFYFIPAAIINLYSVTLPGVYPWQSLQAVRIMVSQRRLEVVRHLLIFIIFTVGSYLILLLLLVTYLPRFANLSLDIFFLAALPVIHTMMYKLYLLLLDGAKNSAKNSSKKA